MVEDREQIEYMDVLANYGLLVLKDLKDGTMSIPC